MKKLQLIGFRKRLMKNRTPVYPPLHVLSLPNELLIIILSHLTKRDILHLAIVCSQLNQLVINNFLYSYVSLKNLTQLSCFNKTLSKKKHAVHSLVKKVTINKPAITSNNNMDYNIGSFSFQMNNSSTNGYDYIENLLSVLKFCSNLKSLKITEISPKFEVDSSFSSIRLNNHIKVESLELVPQSGWSIPFRPNMVWAFGSIDELVLKSFVVDGKSFQKSRFLTLMNDSGIPNSDLTSLRKKHSIQIDESDELGMENYYSPIKTLVINSCEITLNASLNISKYFFNVTTLKLVNIKRKYDLSIIAHFPNLKKLHLDLNSKIFHPHNSSSSKDFLSNYSDFDNFFSILCSNSKILELHLLNVNFIKKDYCINENELDCLDIENSEQNQSVNLFKFLSNLSNVKYLFMDLITDLNCKKCGVSSNFELPDSKSEWQSLLKPLLTNSKECNISINGSNGKTLFCVTNEN